MELETINKLYLELSQFATATPERELFLERANKSRLDYNIALCEAIESHCRGERVPTDVAARCPYHAAMLDKDLSERPST